MFQKVSHPFLIRIVSILLLFSSTVSAFESLHGILRRQDSCTNYEDVCSDGSDPSDCINYICANCTNISLAIPRCCADSDPVAELECFENALEDVGGGSDSSSGLVPSPTASVNTKALSSSPASMTTGAAATGAGQSACDNFQSTLTACDNKTPGLADFTAFSDQAPCLCSSSSSNQGYLYDGYFSSCLAFLSNADATGYAALSASAEGPITSTPCAALANGATTAPRPTNLVAQSTGTTAPGNGKGTSVATGGGFLVLSSTSAPTVTPAPNTPAQPEPSSASGSSSSKNLNVCLVNYPV